MPSVPGVDWPGVAGNAVDRLPTEHLVAGWYIVLLVAAVAAVIAWRRVMMRLLGAVAPVRPYASLSAEQIEDAVATGVQRTINGSLDRMERQIAELSRMVQGNRSLADERHDQNIRRLAVLEAYTRRNSPGAWDGRERRGGRPE